MPGLLEPSGRTRLPVEARALAGLVTLCSIVSSIMQTPSVSDGASAGIEHATALQKAPSSDQL